MGMPFIVESSEKNAQLVSSLTKSGLHAPVLDIDFPTTVTKNGDEFRVCISTAVPSGKQMQRLNRRLATCGLAASQDSSELESKPADGVVITLNVPVELVPSSTAGHFHLYIDREITWANYRWLLLAMRDAGLIGQDFCTMCLGSLQSFVRKPNVTKQAAPETAQPTV
jgi:hypothetical protein